jgi:uncharacterized membrane protein YccC
MDLLFITLSIKRMLYLLLIAGTVLFFVQYKGENQAYYSLVIAAFMFALIPLRGTFYRSIRTLFLTGLCAALLSLLAGFASHLSWLLTAYLFVVTISIGLLSQRYPDEGLPLFVVNLLVLFASRPALTFDENVSSALFILLASGIAIVLHMVSWPYFARSKWQACVIHALRELRQLNKEIFSCLLQPEYAENVYLFERRLHLQKEKASHARQCLHHAIEQLEAKLHEEEKILLKDFFAKVSLLYKMMLDYAQIRWRVADHSTFAVCAPELEAINDEINSILTESIHLLRHKKYHLHTARLKEKITKLEENFHYVLQVAAREPLVFLLFISSLKAFDGEINALREVELKVRLRLLWHT